MAFVFAGIIAVASFVWAWWLSRMNYERAIPKDHSGSVPTLIVGWSFAAVMVWSHWWDVSW